MAGRATRAAGAPQRSPGDSRGERHRGWCAAAFLSVLTSGVSADPPSSSERSRSDPLEQALPQEAGALPEVTIKARRANLERRLRTLFSHITITSHDNSIALWRTPICPLVAGLPRTEAEFVLARLSEIAASAGAPLAPEKCKPNFYVVVTPQPVALLKEWHARDRAMFGDTWLKNIRRFINTPRSVRIWYNVEIVAADGAGLRSPEPVFNNTLLDALPINPNAHATRLEFNELLDLSSVIVIVDLARVSGLELRQVTDYIAMIGLTKLKVDADIGDAPTILRLFTPGGAAPAGLSDWDRSFLSALYHTNQNSRAQLAEITDSVLSEVEP